MIKLSITIITNKEDELRKKIMEDTGRGITLISARGGYTQKGVGRVQRDLDRGQKRHTGGDRGRDFRSALPSHCADGGTGHPP